MQTCPICATALKTVRRHQGLFYLCPGCNGRAVTIPQIRRVAGDRFATGLLRQINANSEQGSHRCPFCSRWMRWFHSDNPRLELDACKPCGAVWFDPGEFESLPEIPPPSPDELQQRTVEVIAKHRLEQLKQRQTTQGPPEETWKWIPGIFGFPVETETDPLRTQPWLTWVLALAITAASLCGFSNLNAAVNALGFVPADPMRWGGLTFFSSFFLHGGLLHLLGNLYFLLIFGDNVEDFLGRKRYGLLILASALTGDLVHLALAGASDIPCIGASAGISGIIVFYALKFPQARLGILFRFSLLFRWVQIPAWGALVLWLLLQFLLVSLELHGLGDVAASAHLGGAAAGFLLWLRWRYSERQTDDPGESGNGR